MQSLTEATINGFNTYLEELKTVQKEVFLTLITFSDEHQTVWEKIPVKECNPITTREYHPDGMTALNDAVGDAIVEMQNYVD